MIQDLATNARPAFRILALDGGGIRGIFTASILAEIERRWLEKRSIATHFDLLAGTSTGGIIALALGLGYTAQQICEFYRERGPTIFPTNRFWRRQWLHFKQIFFAPYSPETLRKAACEGLGGERPLSVLQKRVVVPSYQATLGNVCLFKHLLPEDEATVTARGYEWANYLAQKDLPITDVMAATAAAPTFFPAKKLPLPSIRSDEQHFLDGGIWANCPALAGLAEAVGPLGRVPSDVRIVSVGTRFNKLKVGRWRRIGGFLPWNTGVLDLLLNAQAAGTIGTARWLVGKPNFLRLDKMRGTFSPVPSGTEPVPDYEISLDDVRHTERLHADGKAVVAKRQAEIQDFFKRHIFRPTS